MRQDLLEGKSAGADGDVSESDWSNNTIFRKDKEQHLWRVDVYLCRHCKYEQ